MFTAYHNPVSFSLFRLGLLTELHCLEPTDILTRNFWVQGDLASVKLQYCSGSGFLSPRLFNCESPGPGVPKTTCTAKDRRTLVQAATITAC